LVWARQKRMPGRYRLVLGVGLLGLAVLLCLGAGRLLGSAGPFGSGALWRILGVRVAPPAPTDGAPAGAGSEPSPGSGGGNLIVAGAEFIWIVHYDLCGCTERDTSVAQDGLAGLDRQTLTAELRDWEIVTFAPARVEVRRSEGEAMCSRHSRRVLRLESGKLVLYAGSLDDPAVALLPLQPTSITEDDLAAAEVEMLRGGRGFSSQDEVVRFLEGLGD